jgi:hypothetical protein
VSLGEFESGAEVELVVKLEVPIEMGNEFQNAIGALDWHFKVQAYEVEEETTESVPPTNEEPSEEVMVDVLAEFVPTGNTGSCLPTVTTADNGKFLRASGGRWLAQDDDCEPMSLAEIEKLLNNLT